MKNNVSVIVFSKGRPMQLHAYLESMLKFSDAAPEDITVLCCETEGIRYDKVKAQFAQVNWCIEKKFEEDLKKAVAAAGDYIIFGCDDVVFTRPFALQKAAAYLEQSPEVFGFSIRLGQNIVPYPKRAVCKDGIMKWNWEECGEQHYSYPWELDCTVYRKSDVQRLIDQEEKAIKNPNYLEAIISIHNRSIKIQRKYLACNQDHGCAVVITVNRVQESYQNGFDDSMMTDIYSLDRLYNDEDNTLDIDKIAQLENHVVHVGSEYFLLRRENKAYSQQSLKKKQWKNLTGTIEKFGRKSYNYVERRVYRHGLFEKKLCILNTKKTLKTLMDTPKSFVRFGESEILLMQGKTVSSQQYDEKLARRLKKILASKEENLLIGIPYYYIYPREKMTPYMEIRSLSVADQRRFLFGHCRRDTEYIDAGFTQAYHLYETYDFEKHFKRAEKLLSGRDVTVICGEGALDRLQYRLLDVCKSVAYQYGPASEAFSHYNEILKQALKIKKDRLICVALGPTAKPLVYDLYKKGYQVWDIGHLPKDYDAYKRNKPRTEADIIQFYLPD